MRETERSEIYHTTRIFRERIQGDLDQNAPPLLLEVYRG